MAPRPPLASLRQARITFGGTPLFEDVTLAVAAGERACLVGRNGCGKSTLLRVLAGEVELDGGERFVAPGVRVAYLPQNPDLPGGMTVADHVAGGLPPETATDASRHLVDAVLHRLDIAGDARLDTLSGGEGRRAALARALVSGSDVLLLDEPTNHLDLPTIEWLEGELARFKGGLLIVSHDRALLTRVSRRTLWLDRGRLRRLDQGFAAYENWSAEVIEREEVEAAKLGKRIASELKWLREGLSARRKRNQGRLRRIEGMRRERAARIAVAGRVKLAARASAQTARLVIDAEDISKSFAAGDGERRVIDGFSSRIQRGDRVGIIGSNGTGKTTLLRILCGDLAPDSGHVRLGPGVVPVYFDQRRAALDPEATLWEVLCGGGDQIMVRGRPRHVVGYMRDFLFDERQAKSPVKSLSGGERSRLLLAQLLARESNLLVLDEPTNDLDLETLDLLQEVLGDYDGSLLVVSHDRDFLDRVVTSIVAHEGRGRWQEYAGGYSDYLVQRGAVGEAGEPAKRAAARSPAKTRQRPPLARLGYKQQRELQRLPETIDELGAGMAALEHSLADPTFYERDRGAFDAAASRLEDLRAELAQAEERWLDLETLREERERSTDP